MLELACAVICIVKLSGEGIRLKSQLTGRMQRRSHCTVYVVLPPLFLIPALVIDASAVMYCTGLDPPL
jgi:hypothetical protein